MQTGLWVLDVHDAITGVDNQPYQEKLGVYPNPTNGEVCLTGKGTGMVRIYDLFGSLVMVCKSDRLDMSILSDGMYLLKTTDNIGVLRTSKIIKY